MKMESNLSQLIGQIQEHYMKIAEKKSEEAVEIAREAGEIIHAQAVRLAPVDTGKLRKSIKYKEQSYGADVWVNLEQAPYSLFVELGTKRASAQPFWRPALAKGKQHMFKEIEKLSQK